MSSHKNKKKRFKDKSLMKQREKKKMLLKMKKEIESLQFEIKNIKLVNTKIKTIKNLKISAKALQLAAPYILTTGIVTGSYIAISGDIPFIGGREKVIYSNVMTQFDNKGNIKYQQQYAEFLNTDSRITYYSKWLLQDDGLYSRNIKTYSLKNMKYMNIMELFNEPDLSLDDVLGTPSSNIKESKNNITKEELAQEAIIQATIYNTDKNDYIIRKETVTENIGLSLLYLIITILTEYIPIKYRQISSFDFSDSIEEIINEHQPINVEELKKKLAIKQSNYNRLMR